MHKVKYGIMPKYSSSGVSYLVSNVKQLLNIAKNSYMGKAVIVWTSEKEITLLVEKNGFFWPTWKKTSAKEISRVLNKKED